MVDTHALGACVARRGGSSPLSGTKNIRLTLMVEWIFLVYTGDEEFRVWPKKFDSFWFVLNMGLKVEK